MVLLTVTAFTADARFSFFTVSAFLTGSAAPPAAIALISASTSELYGRVEEVPHL